MKWLVLNEDKYKVIKVKVSDEAAEWFKKDGWVVQNIRK